MIQPWHWIVIIIVALIIFGPKGLPEVGRWLAKGIREFRGGMQEAGEGFHEAMTDPVPAAPTPKPAERTCAQCGATILNDSQFCHKCGTKLTV